MNPHRKLLKKSSCQVPLAGSLWSIFAIILVLMGLAGCSKLSFGTTEAGLAGSDAHALTLVVAQTRAQYPKLSATKLTYTQRPLEASDKKEGSGAPELVLMGQGTSVKPGVQGSRENRLQVQLYLQKPGYDEGYALISEKGAQTEKWPILAFDKKGRGDENFEFLYLLLTPSGQVRYLALIGGTYEDGGKNYRGLEGTLVEPDLKKGVKGWRRAFKVDFGYRQDLQPEVLVWVNEAQKLFRHLDRRMNEMSSLRTRVMLLGDQAAKGDMKAKNEHQKHKAQLEAEAGLGKEELLRYYTLREKIAPAYQDFTMTNGYRWVSLEQQQAFFDQWKQVELHHPRIDDITESVAIVLPDGASLRATQKKALEVVGKADNWNKNPARGWRSGEPGGSGKKASKAPKGKKE